jgi:hypothetical protein
MTAYLDSLAASVDALLDDGPASANDLVALAISGEQLRRGIELAGSVSADPHRILERYDAFLSTAAVLEWPAELADDIQGALDELRAYGVQSRRLRSLERGEQLLIDLDHVLSIAAAETRAGHRTPSQLEELAESIRPTLSSLAPRLLDLAQLAEDRLLVLGSDPEYPELFAFYEELARFAPTRIMVENAVIRHAEKRRLIEAAVADFEKPTLVERLRDHLQAISEQMKFLVAVPAPATAASVARFDSATSVREFRPLTELDGLEIFTDGQSLRLVAAGHELRPLEARAVPEAELAFRRVSDDVDDVVCLDLPRHESIIHLVVEVDGERLDLPPIRVEPPA